MKRPPRRIRRHATLLSLLFTCVAVALAWWFDHTVNAAVLRARDVAVARLERFVGRGVAWDSISPSLLQGITIHNVRIGTNGAGETMAHAARVTVGYRIEDLLARDFDRLLSHVSIHDPVIRYVDTRDRAFLQALLELGGTGQGRQEDLSIEIHRGLFEGTFDGAFGGAHLSLRRVSATVQMEGETLSINVDADSWVRAPEHAFEVQSVVSVRAEGDRSFDPVSATVRLGAATATHFAARPIQLRFERSGPILSAQKIADRLPVDLEVVLNLETLQLDGRLLSRNFAGRDFAVPGGAWQSAARWFGMPVTTDTRFALNLSTQRYRLDGSISTDLALAELPEPLALETGYTVTNDMIRLRDARLATRRGGELYFDGTVPIPNLLPSGRFVARNFAFGELPTVDGGGEISSTGALESGTMQIVSDVLRVSGVPVYQPDIRIDREQTFTNVVLNGRLSSLQRDIVRVQARLSDFNNLQARVEMVDFHSQRALNIARTLNLTVPEGVTALPPLIGTGTFMVNRSAGVVQVEVRHLAVLEVGNPERTAVMRGTVQNGTVVVDRLLTQFDGYTGEASGLIRIGSGGTVDFVTDFSIQGIEYALRGLYTPNDSLVLAGSYGLQARLFFARGRSVVFQVELQETPLPFADMVLSASIDGVVLSQREWYATVRSGKLIGVPLPGNRLADVEWNATILPDQSSIAVTRMFDGISALAGTVDLSYPQGIEGVADLSARFGAVEGQELYQLSARFDRNQFDAELQFARSPLVRFVPTVQRGTFNGAARAVGPWLSPDVEVVIETRNATINDNELTVRAQAALTRTAVRAVNVEFALGGQRVHVSSAEVDRLSGAIALSGRFEIPERGVIVPWDAEGRSAPLERIAAAVRTPAELTLALQTRTPFVLDIRRDGEGRTEFAERGGALEGSILDSGEFQVATAAPLPFHARGSGTLRRGILEASIPQAAVDLPGLSNLLRIPVLSITSGVARGSVRMLGPVGDPEFFGTLRADNVVLSTVFSPDPAGPFSGAVVMDERTIRVQPVTVNAGAAQIRADARFLLSRFQLDAFRITVRTMGEEGYRVVQAFGPVEVNGYGRGTLQIDGTPAAVRVLGSVQSYGTQIAVDPRFDPESMPPPEVPLIVDLAVSTGRGVQFIWPNTDFPILRSNFATEQALRIFADTGSGEFRVDGTVDIQSGDMLYFDRSFIIRDGRILFQETAEQFDPRLTARAEIREASPQGTVRIYLVADGQRLSEFSPRFESDPPLATGDIVAILGGNILAQSGDGPINLQSALLSTSDIVTQFGVFRRFEESVRRRFDLDLFAVRTSVLQNILLTAIEPTDGQTTPAPSLGNYLNNTSVFIGRYIGSSVFAQLLLQMRSADLSLPEGQDDGIQRFGGVLIDSEISLEWQTPFFLLGWTFAPQNPDELFIRDNTFTFSWRLSY